MQRWFVRSREEWDALAERLKQMACPHCNMVGMLIGHGSLHGFDETSSRPSLRARRVFCSNRNVRPGCGRTVSVWFADKIRRLSVTTGCLLKFLKNAVADSISAAIRAVGQRSDRTWQRIWKRFDLGQSKIRTALLGCCPPPKLPAEPRPLAQVVAHLQAAFPDADPIAAFQHTLRTFFV
jgi:hypothetical protein